MCFRGELLGAQDELRKVLSKEEWDQTVKVLNSGVEAFTEITKAMKAMKMLEKLEQQFPINH